MGRWSEHLASPFLTCVDVTPGGHVLDVACGTGVLSNALAEAGASVIGVDASEGYLEGARRHRPHPNIAYEVGDMRHMRFDDNSFDAAVSTLALDVLPEIEQVVAEMKRVTRPGGVVASGIHQFFGGMPAFDLVIHTGAVLDNDFTRLRSMPAGRQLFWPNGQAELWRKMGLTDVTEVPVVRGLRVSVLHGLLGYVHRRPGQRDRPFNGTFGRCAQRDRAPCSCRISGWLARWTPVISHDLASGARRGPSLSLAPLPPWPMGRPRIYLHHSGRTARQSRNGQTPTSGLSGAKVWKGAP